MQPRQVSIRHQNNVSQPIQQSAQGVIGQVDQPVQQVMGTMGGLQATNIPEIQSLHDGRHMHRFTAEEKQRMFTESKSVTAWIYEYIRAICKNTAEENV